MSLTDISPTVFQGTSGTAANSVALDREKTTKDQFLQLLVAQLKNQDPLQPPDANKLGEQITAFGQLEQLFNLNSTTEKMYDAQGTSQKAQAAGIIGKDVEVQGDKLEVGASSTSGYGFMLGQDADTVTVTISDQTGKTVRTVTYRNQNAGENYYAFDGKDSGGNALVPGTYQVSVEALGADGATLQSSSIVRGRVTGVEFTGSGTVVRIGGSTFPLGQIVSISEQQAQQQS